MGRYGWLLVIGVVLLAALGWFGAGKTLAEDDTHLGPPVVIPSPTAPPSPPAPTAPTEEPTLDTSQSPAPKPSASSNSTGTANGADRIKPGPPRTAGDDDDDIDDVDDDDDSDDADDDDDHDDDADHDDDRDDDD